MYIHNIADFVPSACSCLGRCTKGACAKDGEAPRKITVEAQLDNRMPPHKIFDTDLIRVKEYKYAAYISSLVFMLCWTILPSPTLYSSLASVPSSTFSSVADPDPNF